MSPCGCNCLQDIYIPAGLPAKTGKLTSTPIDAKGISVATVNGTVRMTKVTGSEVNVSTVNGSISLEGRLQHVEGRTTNGSISLVCMGEDSMINLKTVNGRIKVQLPHREDIGFTVDARSHFEMCVEHGFLSDKFLTQRLGAGRKVEGQRTTGIMPSIKSAYTAFGKRQYKHSGTGIRRICYVDKLFAWLTIPAVGLTIAGIIVLAILLYHIRQMALIRTGLIKKSKWRRRRIDYDTLFGGMTLLALGGAIAAAKYYEFSFWMGFWIFIALLGLALMIKAFWGRERWLRIDRD